MFQKAILRNLKSIDDQKHSVGYQINNSDNSNFKTTFHIYTAPKRLERKYTNMQIVIVVDR